MLKYKLDRFYPTILRYVLDKRGWVRANVDDLDFDLYWRNGRFLPAEIGECTSRQRFNHFLRSGLITRKAGTNHFLKIMRKNFGEIYDFTPPAFIVNQENLQDIISKLSPETKNRMWIIKPSTGCQGKGIRIIDSLENLTLNDPDRIYLAQLYLTNPMLINGFKHDLRIYVLVTSFHPMTIYLYREGLCRFATVPFDSNNNLDKKNLMYTFKHFTNTSINKYNPIFSSNSSSNNDDTDYEFNNEITKALGLGSRSIRTLKQFFVYLDKKGIDYRPIWNEIEKIVILTLLPLAENIPQTEARCFELYGFDIMIDEKLKPWLIEVNCSPSFGGHTTTDQTIKEPLIEDIIDTLNFKPPKEKPEIEHIIGGERVKQPFKNEQYYAEFCDFLTRSSNSGSHSNGSDLFHAGAGNFKCIFPFNRETLEASNKFSVGDNIEEQKSIIVENIEKKYVNPPSDPKL